MAEFLDEKLGYFFETLTHIDFQMK